MLHETFRRFNYAADDLFVYMHPASKAVQFSVKYQGQEFTIDVARGVDIEAFMAEWLHAIDWWNTTSTKEEREQLWERQRLSVQELTQLIGALQHRGFPTMVTKASA
jgi:hypothetical protein